jgi:hypothetical protein
VLDLSWNSICNFESLVQALGIPTNGSSLCPALVELESKGNALTDAGVARLCGALQASGATPLLKGGAAEGGMESDPPEGSDDDKGRLRRCLRLIADGDATNAPVCRLALWENNADGVADEKWVEQALPTELIAKLRNCVCCQKDSSCRRPHRSDMRCSGETGSSFDRPLREPRTWRASPRS